MIPTPIRLTTDELTALARLMGLETDLGVTEEDADILVASGERSLIARGLLRFGDSGQVLVPPALQRLAVAAHRPRSFLLMARSDGSGVPLTGRVLIDEEGQVLVQEPVFPGIFAFIALDPTKVYDFLLATFALDENPDQPSPEAGEEVAHLKVTQAPDGLETEFPSQWSEPMLNAIVRATPSDQTTDGVSWVVEGSATWIFTGGGTESSPDLVAERTDASDIVARIRGLSTIP